MAERLNQTNNSSSQSTGSQLSRQDANAVSQPPNVSLGADLPYSTSNPSQQTFSGIPLSQGYAAAFGPGPMAVNPHLQPLNQTLSISYPGPHGPIPPVMQPLNQTSTFANPGQHGFIPAATQPLDPTTLAAVTGQQGLIPSAIQLAHVPLAGATGGLQHYAGAQQYAGMYGGAYGMPNNTMPYVPVANGAGEHGAPENSVGTARTPKYPTGPEGCNLFIFHLPPDIDDNKLFQMFQPFGEVISATVHKDEITQQSMGYGFVSYTNPTSAQWAILLMNRKKVGNKMLSVRLKQPKQQ